MFTIGHGSRTIEELAAVIAALEIRVVIDVRAMPRSRRHPQFSRVALERALSERGVEYVWEGAALGGFRKGSAGPGGSRHVALEGDVFQGYAEHMESAEFREAIGRVVESARTHAEGVAVMCAEREFTECHRRMIADALVARGERVVHAVEVGRAVEHVLSEKVRVAEGGVLIYDRGVSRGFGF